ncbi:NAD(P)-dependent oxidoreductase [Actinosynnema pretiosum]|uniref:NAD(P)-dependent oxidoreductase n=1 Tax=Actinosynnema pretiosum TaxID=42197 RepID=UPI0012FDA978|nr:NAD(P)H-binding protein [Actinosynnema pretiosum]
MNGLRLVVLGATGGVGGHVVAHALRRGHSVTALSRDPRGLPGHGSLRVAAVDVRDRDAVAEALAGSDAVVSALGNPPRSGPGVLAAGAASLVAAAPPRLVWLGAHGTGPSATAATSALLRLALGAEEVADKVAADALVLAAGGTVVHAGPLTGPAVDRTTLGAVALGTVAPGTVAPGTVASDAVILGVTALNTTAPDTAIPEGARLLPLGARRLPRPVRRATLAALLLAEAEQPAHAGAVALAAG